LVCFYHGNVDVNKDAGVVGFAVGEMLNPLIPRKKSLPALRRRSLPKPLRRRGFSSLKKIVTSGFAGFPIIIGSRANRKGIYFFETLEPSFGGQGGFSFWD
jgi:hypothetical protein